MKTIEELKAALEIAAKAEAIAHQAFFADIDTGTTKGEEIARRLRVNLANIACNNIDYLLEYLPATPKGTKEMKTIGELRADVHAAVHAIRSVPLGNPKPVTTAQIELYAAQAAYVAAREAVQAAYVTARDAETRHKGELKAALNALNALNASKDTK